MRQDGRLSDLGCPVAQALPASMREFHLCAALLLREGQLEYLLLARAAADPQVITERSGGSQTSTRPQSTSEPSSRIS